MAGNVIVPAFSLILVVGVALGVVAVVHFNNKDDDPRITGNVKAVQSICEHAEDQKLCHETLVPSKGSQDPKEYYKTAVETTINSVIKSLNMTNKLSVEHGNKDKGIKMALDDCKEMLDLAIDSLEASAKLVRENDIQAIYNNTADFTNWLSATISYHQTCMDSFDTDGEKKVREQLQSNGLNDMGKLTGMTLDIVSDLSKILESFHLKLNVKPASTDSRRRLLSVNVDSQGFPTWFSAADRKLMAQLQKKGGHHLRITPNVVVAQDGSGTHKSIADAIAAVPKNSNNRFVIYVKAGVYKEYVTVPKDATRVLMYGDGPTRTIITGNKNYAAGTKTMETATFSVIGQWFIAKSMRFENTAGWAGHQAVALRVSSDMSAFFDCGIHGYQDTLYVHANRQFYRNCEISGTIDFIFGHSRTIIQNSKIIVRKPGPSQFNTVTADGTERTKENTGIVIQNCEILPEKELYPERFQVKSYLGRPWKASSTTVVMESTIGDFVQPDGWTPWDGNIYLDTLYYAEYNNRGPGAALDRRVKWKGYRGAISKDEAARFIPGAFLEAGPSGKLYWLKATGIPYQIGFIAS
ncbi:hypothetical protein L6164_010351 [Bauhinia variegata]|uniref:Uncharacterized protein n=1 Tax=Bauhinia variegata TaxID=167791 RepID=A0ACB9PP85_BAUVA|nr:hypothetical protein L6164_010351 [Bauhinia variegata]